MTDQQYSAIDRREAKRVQTTFALRYRIKDQEETPERAVNTIDLSTKSVLFEDSVLLGIGTEVSVILEIPSLPEPVKAEGHINRILEREKGTLYRYCVLFESISEEDRKNIETYVESIDVENLLRLAVEQAASDVHFIANYPPVFRVNGELTPLDFPPISAQDLNQMILSMMTEKQKAAFAENLEQNFSYLLREGVRFRVNVHQDKGNMEAALRIIPSEIKGFDELGLPPVLKDLVQKKRGLIIISGPTGSGKTTTLAAMIDAMNRERNSMIISIEDPIEYVHESMKSIIKQREVGSDTLSFATGLKNILRQDPNVILIGELRNLESVTMAITAADTGHLVLTSMHTSDAIDCINRIVDMYPAEHQEQVRSQLAGCLEAVMTQILLPKKDGSGRVAATEVLVGTPTVKKMIRDGTLKDLPTYMEAGLQFGMHSLDTSLKNLVKDGLVDEGLAKGFAKNPKSFGAVVSIQAGQSIPPADPKPATVL